MKRSTNERLCTVENLPALHVIRAHFVARQTTLGTWARLHGYDQQLVWHALTKGFGGKKTLRIVHEIKKELAS